MIFCDNSLDRTSGYDLLSKVDKRTLFVFMDVVLTWEPYWIIVGYLGSDVKLDNFLKGG